MKHMREHMGLLIVWSGGRDILVKDGDRVIERHPAKPNQPRLAALRITWIAREMTKAALAMELVR